VDLIPPTVADPTLAEWFGGMLEAEIAFHDAVFE